MVKGAWTRAERPSREQAWRLCRWEGLLRLVWEADERGLSREATEPLTLWARQREMLALAVSAAPAPDAWAQITLCPVPASAGFCTHPAV